MYMSNAHALPLSLLNQAQRLARNKKFKKKKKRGKRTSLHTTDDFNYINVQRFLLFETTAELRSCVKVGMDVLATIPNKPMVSVDVKQHFNQQN